MSGKIGRPPKYESPEQMQVAIDQYFKQCEAGKKTFVIRRGKEIEKTVRIPKTVSGLALALGFSSRRSILNYQEKDEFLPIISRAKLEIENDNLEGGFTGEYEARICALNLSANFGYATKKQIENDIKTHSEVLRELENKRLGGGKPNSE